MEVAVTHVIAESENEVIDDAMVAEGELDETESVAFEPENSEIRKSGETTRLLSDKADYMRMSVAEKVRCYPLDDKGRDVAFEMVQAYFEKIGEEGMREKKFERGRNGR